MVSSYLQFSITIQWLQLTILWVYFETYVLTWKWSDRDGGKEDWVGVGENETVKEFFYLLLHTQVRQWPR